MDIVLTQVKLDERRETVEIFYCSQCIALQEQAPQLLEVIEILNTAKPIRVEPQSLEPGVVL